MSTPKLKRVVFALTNEEFNGLDINEGRRTISLRPKMPRIDGAPLRKVNGCQGLWTSLYPLERSIQRNILKHPTTTSSSSTNDLILSAYTYRDLTKEIEYAKPKKLKSYFKSSIVLLSGQFQITIIFVHTVEISYEVKGFWDSCL